MEAQDVDGWTVLECNLDRMGSYDWIDLAQDRDQWRTFVKTVINLRVL
jgi:hypothetical protein